MQYLQRYSGGEQHGQLRRLQGLRHRKGLIVALVPAEAHNLLGQVCRKPEDHLHCDALSADKCGVALSEGLTFCCCQTFLKQSGKVLEACYT